MGEKFKQNLHKGGCGDTSDTHFENNGKANDTKQRLQRYCRNCSASTELEHEKRRVPLPEAYYQLHAKPPNLRSVLPTF